jgi:hypothetical protein
MRYKAKNIAALHIVLSGLPDKMRVQVDPDIQYPQRLYGVAREQEGAGFVSDRTSGRRAGYARGGSASP